MRSKRRPILFVGRLICSSAAIYGRIGSSKILSVACVEVVSPSRGGGPGSLGMMRVRGSRRYGADGPRQEVSIARTGCRMEPRRRPDGCTGAFQARICCAVPRVTDERHRPEKASGKRFMAFIPLSQEPCQDDGFSPRVAWS